MKASIDAILIWSTNLHGHVFAAELESEIGLPVIDSRRYRWESGRRAPRAQGGTRLSPDAAGACSALWEVVLVLKGCRRRTLTSEGGRRPRLLQRLADAGSFRSAPYSVERHPTSTIPFSINQLTDSHTASIEP